MRSTLLATLALTATLTSAFAPSIADACGGYMRDPLPAVFAVDDHDVLVPGTQSWHRRAFVVLGGAQAAAETSWSMLSPGTYGSARIADLPDPAQSTTFTLVGPSGARVVSTNRSALLARTFRTSDAQSTLEIDIDDRSQFRIAVLGTQPGASWLEATEVEATKQNKQWVKQQGLDATSIYVTKIKGTQILVISAYQPNDIVRTSMVVIDGNSIGAYTGTAIGALVMGTKRYVVLETNGAITLAAV